MLKPKEEMKIGSEAVSCIKELAYSKLGLGVGEA